MTICTMAYLNGAFCSAADARISVFDRGFLFAHAAYEVTAVYGGNLVDFGGHVARLGRTLAGIGIPDPLAGGGGRYVLDGGGRPGDGSGIGQCLDCR